MEELKKDLITRGLDFSILPREMQNLVTRANKNYIGLKPEKRAEFVEKFIDILADAENNLNKLSTEVGFKDYLSQTEDTVGMIATNIESKEAFKIRKDLYEMAGINKIPSRNGVMSQVLMAVIDEFVISIGDLAVDIYKTWDKKGCIYILTEIKNTVLSGDTWVMISKELGNGLYGIAFDWDTSKDDFIYKKTRSLLIAAGLAMLMKSVGKKIVASIAKNTLKKTVVVSSIVAGAHI